MPSSRSSHFCHVHAVSLDPVVDPQHDGITVRSISASTARIHAVDDITLSVRKNEIYGLAGESSSGKTTLIKTFATAIRPPLRIVDGSMTYHFKNGDIDPYAAAKSKVEALRWKHLSYIMQGSMSLLKPPAADSQNVRGLRLPADGAAQQRVLGPGRIAPAASRLVPNVLSAYPHQLSGGMRQRVTMTRWRRSVSPSSSSPTNRPRRSAWWCRRTCWR